jgi:RimJ/RimL family protein N-acetyltransferase
MRRSVERVRLQPFHPRRDIDRVAAWLRAPHIVRWWGDPEKQLLAVLARPVEGGDALIVADGVTVGYVRWQQAPRAELEAAGLHEIPEGSIDIDIAIGEADYIGRGVGSRALHLVVQQLRSEKSTPRVLMGTSVENAIAIRACEKAGFRRLRTFDDPEYGLCWLLVYEAPRPATRAEAASV